MMKKSFKHPKEIFYSQIEKLSGRSQTVLIALSVVLFVVIVTLGFLNQNMGDRTVTNCTVSSPQSVENHWSKLPIETSCGYVYIYGHTKNSYGARPYAAIEMRNALASGKPLTIKATGITGMLMAYEITPSE
jgi:hypothetical protein